MWNKGLVMLQGPLPPTCNLGGPARAYPYIEHRARGPQQGRPHIEHRAGGPQWGRPPCNDNSPSLRRWLAVGQPPITAATILHVGECYVRDMSQSVTTLSKP